MEDSEGRAAIDNAVYSDSVEAVELLLESGANPNHQTSSTKRTPLLTAVRRDNVEMARLLVSRGADL